MRFPQPQIHYQHENVTADFPTILNVCWAPEHDSHTLIFPNRSRFLEKWTPVGRKQLKWVYGQGCIP
jgi:hypothetical protein